MSEWCVCVVVEKTACESERCNRRRGSEHCTAWCPAAWEKGAEKSEYCGYHVGWGHFGLHFTAEVCRFSKKNFIWRREDGKILCGCCFLACDFSRWLDSSGGFSFFFFRLWVDHGNEYTQKVSRIPATRMDILNLQEKLDVRLEQQKARETGLCPIRRELYAQAFGEAEKLKKKRNHLTFFFLQNKFKSFFN